MSPKTPLKVMLVEDHAPFRQALAFVLQSEQGLEIIAQAGSLAEARRALDGGGLRGRLDVALIDLILPDGDGTDLIAELRRSDPAVKVVVLSADLWLWRIDELLRAGVDAVLEQASPTYLRRIGGITVAEKHARNRRPSDHERHRNQRGKSKLPVRF